MTAPRDIGHDLRAAEHDGGPAADRTALALVGVGHALAAIAETLALTRLDDADLNDFPEALEHGGAR